MSLDRDNLMMELKNIVSTATNRVTALQNVADLLKRNGNYRWVGVYDVDFAVGVVTNVVWSGEGEPEHPTFPITKGLTGSAISARQTVNVADVTADSRYLTAFQTTKSEIIVPVFDQRGENVAGTIDIESEKNNAFGEHEQALLEAYANVIRPLWHSPFLPCSI